MTDRKTIVKIYGARGSMPVSGEKFREFGCATSCLGFSSPGNDIFLDAGTGIISALADKESRISIILTHLHIDHISGLPLFPPLSDKDRIIDIYYVKRGKEKLEEIFKRFFSPPFWPCEIADYPAEVHFHEIMGSLHIGEYTIDSFENNHPGGSCSYKIQNGSESFVYATDTELTGEIQDDFVRFIKGSNVLFVDGHYSASEYNDCMGFGHSTPEMGIFAASEAGIKRIYFTHHSPEHDDSFLSEMEKRIKEKNPEASFVREGERIILNGI